MFLFWVLSLVVGFVVVCVVDCEQSVECGQRKTLARELVHHGTQSLLGEWPWHVALFHRMNKVEPSYACGGTIISKNCVLTAAHCTFPESKVRPLKPKEILIRAGVSNLESLEHSLQQVGVREIFRHEEFNARTLEDDIAVLLTVVEFEFTDFVRPLCLWWERSAEELIIGKKGITPGWGRDEHKHIGDVLKHAGMLIVSRRSCRDSDPEYYTRFLYDRKMFCAGFRNGTTAASGDSGGGFYLEGKDGKWVLRGIVSNGKINATTGFVDSTAFVVFVDVTYYLKWIKKKANINQMEGEAVQDYSICGLAPEFHEKRPWPWQGEVYRNHSGIHRLTDVAIINELFLLSPANVYRNSEIRNPSKLILTFKIFENNRYRLLHSQRLGRIHRHEKFDLKSGLNNIALLELITPLKFTALIHPICLWRANNLDLTISPTNNNAKAIPGTAKLNCTFGENYFCLKTNHLENFNSTFYLEHEGLWYLRGLNTQVHRNNVLLLDVARFAGWIDNNSVFRTKNLLGIANCAKRFINDYTFISTEVGFQCFASHIMSTLLLVTASCVHNLSPYEM